MPDPTIEILQGNLGGSAAGVATVTTALLPTDYVVFIAGVGSNYGAGSPTVSGLGTWTTLTSVGGLGSTGGVGVNVKVLTGVTGGGNISITAGVYGTRYIIYVLRGLTYNALDNFSILDLAAPTGILATTGQPFKPVIARDNSLVLQIYRSTNGAVTMNYTGSSPASGWTNDVNVIGSFDGLVVSRQYFATETWIEPVAKAGNNFSDVRMMLLVFGTPSTSFEGRVHDSYGEIMTVDPAPDRNLYSIYGETVMQDVSPDRNIYAIYGEMLVSPEFALPTGFVGWGMPLI